MAEEEGEIDIEEIEGAAQNDDAAGTGSDGSAAEDEEKEDEEVSPSAARMTRLFELRMKLNKARSLNKTAVLEEFQRTAKGGRPDWKAKKQDWKDRKKKLEEDVADDTLHPDKEYLNTTAAAAEAQEKRLGKRKARQAAFGWEIFGQDATYNSHKKRVTRLQQDHGPALITAYQERKESEPEEAVFPTTDSLVTVGAATSTDPQGQRRVSAELAEQMERRSKWSRRRQFFETADVDYINERNRVFNKKLARAFDPYTKEIKQNLERGTAL
eukprot:TRINITY_DN6200_c0_g1_i1.p2 TRINITY_DN6200_c0_g1~~TRINITY_DN6200_c0_g1_i1.p2  ORF type:complete len:277 (-),score=122.69 TRINITY_DN6200_c0_g1_i1:116-925(-)